MSLAQCKQNFISLLEDPENRVIALSGKWGSGKSHLWKEVQTASPDEKVKGAVYVSLFGLGSIAELKLRIAQGVFPKLQAGGTMVETLKTGYAGVKKILKGVHSGFSALDELALIAAPMMIKGRFIVIDDVERKHDKLSIDEILGFIDECVESLDCRVLLILNSDQLGDKDLWELFREKVIDQELRLDTSPSEAFDIALTLTPTIWAQQIKPAVEACKITNIRIVRKITRVVNRLLGSRNALPEQLLLRVVPSMALLSAIHYKSLEGGPDIDFVLSFESTLAFMTTNELKKRGQQASEEAKTRERWQLLMDELGIRGTDEFEALVVDYLKSGMIDGEAVGKVIDRYAAEERALAARARAYEFFEHCRWHPNMSEAQLLVELQALVPESSQLDMFMVTALHDEAVNLPGGASVADDLVDSWLSAFRRRQSDHNNPDLDPEDTFFKRPLHPAISAEVRSKQAEHRSKVTILDVCKKVRNDRSWGTHEETFMKAVTPHDYEAAIRNVVGSELKLLLLQSMEFYRNGEMYERHFGGAMRSFLDACKNICQREADGRLSRLIRSLFTDAGRESDLAVS